ncbi:MAG TPA: aminotransferase class V-fold PLP-dependent enzyme [Schlesneria sp.]|jgi:dTDP-4-amino-4,6-dideoxygalactose transaminase
MSSSALDLPAILGGTPVRPSGPPEWPVLEETTKEVLRSMVETGDWGRYHGRFVPELCRQLANYHAIEHTLVCCSGTAAIELALRGVGVQEGDEVILAAYDFKANFQNVLHLKALPVLIDLNPVTFQFDASQLTAALTPKTRAILVSHLHGGIVDLPRVREIAEPAGIAIIEDACQNPGAMLYGQRAGTWGDIGVISFGGSKLLTSGRGGAILTSQSVIAERIKRCVLRGNDAYPLSEIQAALVIPQLEALDAMNERRGHAVRRLCSELAGLEGLKALQLPTEELQPSYYKLGFHFTASRFGLSREHFVSALRAEGIAMDAGFRSNHLIHGSRRFRAVGQLTEATRADQEIVTLHHPVLVQDDSAIRQVVEAIGKVHRYTSQIAAVAPPNDES